MYLFTNLNLWSSRQGGFDHNPSGAGRGGEKGAGEVRKGPGMTLLAGVVAWQGGARGRILSSDLHRVTCLGTANLGIANGPGSRESSRTSLGNSSGFHTKEMWKDHASLGGSGVPGEEGTQQTLNYHP